MIIRPVDASTTDNAVLGTLAYLSPEALQGRPPQIYYDLWSLAITLAEAVVGKNPALGLTAGETMERIGLGRIPDLRELLPGLPESIAQFFQDALHLDPARRPPSARGMKARLQLLRAELPSS
jgi:serine/threonine-protein kinase